MADNGTFQSDSTKKLIQENFDLDGMWVQKPEVIKQFINKRSDYEKLCAEVAYILTKLLNNAEIEFSNIVYRAKTLNSFLEKVKRKNYKNPIKEITDFAAVRVVCLYVDDLDEIEQIITEHFEIVEKIDKFHNRETNQFGYGAIHFVVKLGENSSGARYDDLKDLVCEIQIRTVLQDAWAIIDHHLVYKNKSSIPTILRKKLNLLAKTFQSADEEFRRIRNERENYLFGIEKSQNSSQQFLDNELNLDSFVRYSQWKFPELPSGASHIDIPFFLNHLVRLRIRKLSQLDAIVNQGFEKHKHYLLKNGRDFFNSYAITNVVACVFFADPKYTPAKHIKTLFPKYWDFLKNN